MTKQIELSQGLFTTVDDEDFAYLNQWKWYAVKDGKTFYAVRNTGIYPFRKRIYMHRVIMNPVTGMKTDHKDRNGLNNTRHNLRNCTHVQNMQNRGRQSTNTSGYKGVYQFQGKWQAEIRANGKTIYLGRFDTAENAALAYDEAARKHHGEFAVLNFPKN